MEHMSKRNMRMAVCSLFCWPYSSGFELTGHRQAAAQLGAGEHGPRDDTAVPVLHSCRIR